VLFLESEEIDWKCILALSHSDVCGKYQSLVRGRGPTRWKNALHSNIIDIDLKNEVYFYFFFLSTIARDFMFYNCLIQEKMNQFLVV